MNRFEEATSSITSARDCAEYVEYQEKNVKQEKYYKEIPIEQNKDLLFKINKLQESMDESSKQNIISIYLMIATLGISIIGLVVSIFGTFVNK